MPASNKVVPDFQGFETDTVLPKILWHYTSIDTLVKICTTLTMRATHYAFLNDRKEVNLATNLILSEIDRQISQKPDKLIPLQAIRDFISVDDKGERQRGMFVICFSEHPDYLPQWRAYTPQTGGCAIGFNSKLLQNIFTVNDEIKTMRHYQLLQCVYSDRISKIKQEIHKRINFIVQCTDIACNDSERKTMACGLAITYLHNLSSQFKDKSFLEEYEWRCIFNNIMPGEEILYENRKPFIECTIPLRYISSLIKRVIISPHGDIERNLQFVKFFSDTMAHKYLKKRIIDPPSRKTLFETLPSELPYRG